MSRAQPGALVLLPVDSGPRIPADGRSPLQAQLRAEGPAARWVDALLGGSEVLDGRGHALRRASGAMLLAGSAGTSGPLRRRAEIGGLAGEIDQQEAALVAVRAALAGSEARLIELERTAAASATNADHRPDPAPGATAAIASDIGKSISGTGIQAGTVISAVNPGTDEFTLSKPTSATTATAVVVGEPAVPEGIYTITVVNNGQVNAFTLAGATYSQSIISSGSSFTVAEY